MGEFNDILNALNGMKRDKMGRITETQPRGSAPKLEESKEEILDIMNGIRKMNGQAVINESADDLQSLYETTDPVQKENPNSRITEAGVMAYAKLIK